MKNGSDKSSTECGLPFGPRAPFIDTLMPNNLTPLSPPAPPRFPTLFELAGAVDTVERPEPKTDLFGNLIGDPRVLFQDVLDRPEDYEEGLAELLIELLDGRTKPEELDPTRRDMLNRSVLDFAQPPRPKQQQPVVRQQAPEAMQMAEDEYEEYYEPELPSEPQPFWWVSTGAERNRTD